jgi:hypothetical protein
MDISYRNEYYYDYLSIGQHKNASKKGPLSLAAISQWCYEAPPEEFISSKKRFILLKGRDQENRLYAIKNASILPYARENEKLNAG